MPKPIKRRELIRRMRLFGWEGEYQQGKHPFLVKSAFASRFRIRTAVISTVNGEAHLKDADIDPHDWERVK